MTLLDDYGAILDAVKVDNIPAFRGVLAEVRAARTFGNTVFFIGNGGSASIASHMALDFQKAANVKAMCFNDGASLTAYGNDVGYESVFVEPLRVHGESEDILFAISSSGRSANIVNAAKVAKSLGMTVVTLSGFDPNNPLRECGKFNFHVASDRYGVVETTHLAICHAILDEVVGHQ
jgi:D-sedoheptulose 7-phosphate isomerase